MSRGIWTILPRWAEEFCELASGIWQNFPRKTSDSTGTGDTGTGDTDSDTGSITCPPSHFSKLQVHKSAFKT